MRVYLHIVESLNYFYNKYKLPLSIVLTLTFYGFAFFRAFGGREYLRGTVEFEPAGLIVILGIVFLLHLVILPLRFLWLLERFSVNMSFLQAIRDRLVLVSMKAVMPLGIGDPLGFFLVTRKWNLNLDQASVVWGTEKVLALCANLFLLLIFILLGFFSLPLSMLFAASLLFLYLALIIISDTEPEQDRPGGISRLIYLAGEAFRLKGFSPVKKTILVAVTVTIEALEMLVLIILVSQALEYGMRSIDPVRVMGVQFSGMLPTIFGGAGSREAATLLIFSGRGDERALLLAAFATTLALRVLPALPGMLLFLPGTRRKETDRNRK